MDIEHTAPPPLQHTSCTMNLTNAYQDLKSREEWTMLRPLPSPRYYAAVVALNENQAVIMGGYDRLHQMAQFRHSLRQKNWRDYPLAFHECETCETLVLCWSTIRFMPLGALGDINGYHSSIRLKCWTWIIWWVDGKQSMCSCLLDFTLISVKQLPSTTRFTFFQQGRIELIAF